MKKSYKRRHTGSKRRHTRRRVKKQKPIMMVGCSRKHLFSSKCKTCSGNKQHGGYGCGSCGCPIAPYKMNGGSNTNLNPVPGPFVGKPWSPNVSNWPGVDGIGSNRNYLSPYDTTKDPSYQMGMNDSGYLTKSSIVGGKRQRMKGGGLLPQDLVNLGRDFTFNFKSAYNALNGYNAPTNPAPYKDQLTHKYT